MSRVFTIILRNNYTKHASIIALLVMANLSHNYQLRKCFLQREQVPTQSMIKKIMTPPLADVYFKSMHPKVKVLAGLEPPLKGAGDSWYIPPKELLEGRVVLKPFKNKYLSKLNCYGVDDMGQELVEAHRRRIKEDRKRLIYEQDNIWQRNLDAITSKEWEERTTRAAQYNSKFIETVIKQFSILYSTSLTNFQDLLLDAAIKKIKEVRESVFQDMNTKFTTLVQQQATMLYDRYSKKLESKKKRLKLQFIHDLGVARTKFGEQVHDLNLGKHVAIEKLRNYLECQNLACLVYIALKEREECLKEMEESKHEHDKKMKKMNKKAQLQKIAIRRASEKDKKQQEFVVIWKKKVWQVVKHFQVFVSYCLNTLPEQAEFFINMERLMLLQLNDMLENPDAESLFIMDWEPMPTPTPKPHPFFLFCDKIFDTSVNPDLCPRHCTSSASQLPVIVVNKRCIYAACDNFEQLSDRIKDYVDGQLDKDTDVEDRHDYNQDIPVKYTASLQLQELKLESSLLQVLQEEIANARNLPIVCSGCNIAHCFDCTSSRSSKASLQVKSLPCKETSIRSLPPGKILTREAITEYEKQPDWESYMKFVEPKKCDCTKMTKKHLLENLPVYMRKMPYEPAELPNYETCSANALKALVKKARGTKEPSTPPPPVPPKTHEVGSQCSDAHFEYLCTCFSNEGVDKLIKVIMSGIKGRPGIDDQYFRVVGSSISSSYLTKQRKSFAIDRAQSLRHLVDESPDIIEIFATIGC